ncbi:MAG: hypothetical protein AVDCRST_MAG13-570, partial [uncultured Solirubrobacteraceae bacterium]
EGRGAGHGRHPRGLAGRRAGRR